MKRYIFIFFLIALSIMICNSCKKEDEPPIRQFRDEEFYGNWIKYKYWSFTINRTSRDTLYNSTTILKTKIGFNSDKTVTDLKSGKVLDKDKCFWEVKNNRFWWCLAIGGKIVMDSPDEFYTIDSYSPVKEEISQEREYYRKIQ